MKLSDIIPQLPDFLPSGHGFKGEDSPWDWLDKLSGEALTCVAKGLGLEAARAQASGDTLCNRSDLPAGLELSGCVYIHESVALPHYGTLRGPIYLGEGVRLGPGVFLRGPVLAGPGSVLGHACEIKHSMIWPGAEIPHFNYVGDSLLGPKAHLGAGAVLANLRFDQKPIRVRYQGQVYDSKRRKLGSVLGEDVQVGCNVVLQPGTLLPKSTQVLSPKPVFMTG